jgi:hypothetical protein
MGQNYVNLSVMDRGLFRPTQPESDVFYWYIGGGGDGGGVLLGPLGTAATFRSIVPGSSDYDDEDIDGMMIGKGNRSSRRKPAPVPLCPPQTPHAAPTRTRAAAVRSQRLTAWSMARPRVRSLLSRTFSLLHPSSTSL